VREHRRHRSFGVHISFVRSVTMDKWDDKQVSKNTRTPHACTYTHTHKHTHTHTYTCIQHTYTNTYTHTHKHTHTHTRARPHTRIYTGARAHTRTHPHINTSRATSDGGRLLYGNQNDIQQTTACVYEGRWQQVVQGGTNIHLIYIYEYEYVFTHQCTHKYKHLCVQKYLC